MKKIATILLPCLNEEKTLLSCVNDIRNVLDDSDYKNQYQILVCDNGSDDKSVKICQKHQIPYLVEKKRGYGNALLAGIKKADTKYIIMLDCDGSYNSSDIPKFIKKLGKNDLVIGNRFKGGIEQKAMPLSHRIGSKILTEYANLLFRTSIHDYHCGIRGFNREKILECNLESDGFEFASEMIIKSKINHLKIVEIPTKLFRDRRNHKSHLKTFRDGFRHFRKINQIKFKNSKPFRYITTFFAAIFAISLFTFSSCLIPHQLIKDNAINSVSELKDIFIEESKKTSKQQKPYEQFEKNGDIRNYAMIFSTNNSAPLKSAIEMNYPVSCDSIDSCADVLKNVEEPELKEYSRYWQGQSSVIHFSAIFMDVNTFTTIADIIFVLLFIFTFFKLFQADKILSVMFILTSLAINLPFAMRSLEFLPVMFIMLISILLILNAIKKEHSPDLIFLGLGIATCYFDFLTCETIALTVPLIIYIYLKNKTSKKLSLKEIIPLIILWGIGYLGTFAMKWLIDFIHFGPDFLSQTTNYVTGQNSWRGLIGSIIDPITANFSPILPFALIENGETVLLVCIAICFIYNICANREYLIYYLICLIPILRFIVLSGHSTELAFFTYRATFCVILTTLLTISVMVKKVRTS